MYHRLVATARRLHPRLRYQQGSLRSLHVLVAAAQPRLWSHRGKDHIVCNGGARQFSSNSDGGTSLTNPPLSWTPQAVPNPIINPAAAGRPSIKTSAVCDPNNLLTKESQDVIEGYLNDFKSGRCVVVVLSKMMLTSPSVDVELEAKKFAMTLHNSWGVGDKEKGDGILLFLAVHDRVVFISTGRTAAETLTPPAIAALITNMRPFLRQGDLNGALEYAVLEMDGLLSGEVTVDAVVRDAMKREKGSNNKKASSTSSGDGGGASLLGDWRFASGLFLLACVGLYFQSKSNPSLLNRLEKADSDLGRIYESDEVSCPNCFCNYNDHKGARMNLACGHSFCGQCLADMNKQASANGQKAVCLVCGEPAALLAGAASGRQSLQEAPGAYANTTSDNADNVNNVNSTNTNTGKAAESSTGSRDQTKNLNVNTHIHVNPADILISLAEYRLRRYLEMHKETVPLEEAAALKAAVAKKDDPEHGRLEILRQRKRAQERVVQERKAEEARLEAQRKKREEAKKSGSGGSVKISGRDWGTGGTSSGGGGGKW